MLGALHLRPDAKLASLTKLTVEAIRFLRGDQTSKATLMVAFDVWCSGAD